MPRIRTRRVRRHTISLRRTVDGVEVEVRIDPWSPRRALKLQRAAAPAVLVVMPYEDNGVRSGAAFALAGSHPTCHSPASRHDWQRGQRPARTGTDDQLAGPPSGGSRRK
jgi:hypothetical protein